MGVQKKILTRTEVFEDANGTKFESGTGTLIGGTPGQIYDVAYGPVVHTTTLAEPAEIGTYVKGQGVIVNAPEYALYGTLRTVTNGTEEGGPLAPSLMLPTGTVVSCMTAGHVWMTRGAYEDMGTEMNAGIIAQFPKSSTDEKVWKKDLIVVEVNGISGMNYGPSDSTI